MLLNKWVIGNPGYETVMVKIHLLIKTWANNIIYKERSIVYKRKKTGVSEINYKRLKWFVKQHQVHKTK
jgi:hypothetical protein